MFHLRRIVISHHFSCLFQGMRHRNWHSGLSLGKHSICILGTRQWRLGLHGRQPSNLLLLCPHFPLFCIFMLTHHIIIWIAIDNPPSEDNMLDTKAVRWVFFRVKLKILNYSCHMDNTKSRGQHKNMWSASIHHTINTDFTLIKLYQTKHWINAYKK